MDENLNLLAKYIITLVSIVFSALIGYFAGTAKSFREQKQKAYSEILPPILKFAYDRNSEQDEKEFGKALSLLWLYGNKKVTKKMEKAVSIMHHPKKGNVTEALQNVIVEIRQDIQFWPWQNLKPNDVNHLYTKIINK